MSSVLIDQKYLKFQGFQPGRVISCGSVSIYVVICVNLHCQMCNSPRSTFKIGTPPSEL